MKTKTLLKVLPMAMGLLCTSCAYYQLFETKPLTEDLNTEENVLTYEDENCVVLYDFWAEAGNAGVVIINKTTENLYVDKSESFFIMNGMAKSYYQGLVYGTREGISLIKANNTRVAGRLESYPATRQASMSFGAAASSGSFSSTSVSWEEEKVIIIPPRTSKYIQDQLINSTLLQFCDFPNAPSIRDIKPISFTLEETPLTFGNIISYKVGKEGESQTIRNEFYVFQITNYPKKEFIGKGTQMQCEKKETYNFFKKYSPQNFYIKYKSSPFLDESDDW